MFAIRIGGASRLSAETIRVAREGKLEGLNAVIVGGGDIGEEHDTARHGVEKDVNPAITGDHGPCKAEPREGDAASRIHAEHAQGCERKRTDDISDGVYDHELGGGAGLVGLGVGGVVIGFDAVFDGEDEGEVYEGGAEFEDEDP